MNGCIIVNNWFQLHNVKHIKHSHTNLCMVFMVLGETIKLLFVQAYYRWLGKGFNKKTFKVMEFSIHILPPPSPPTFHGIKTFVFQFNF